MTRTIAHKGHAHELKYLDRTTLWRNGVFTKAGDPKHRNILIKHCRGADTRLIVIWSGLLVASAASKVKRTIARVE